MKSLATVVVLSLFSLPAMAQATRTWVSGVGDDANPCSRTAPCKTFAGAISKTAAAGEISVLDPGGFGAVTITKSITIDGRGTLAGITAAGNNAVIINAAATDTVVLRGLSVAAPLTALAGVRVLKAKAVHVEDCSFHSFNNGIEVASDSQATLFVKNTSITNTTTAGIAFLTGTAGVPAARGVIDHSRIVGAKICVDANGAQVIVSDVVTAACADAALRSTGVADVTVERSVLSLSDAGVQQEGASVVRVSDTLIGNNNFGLSGTVASFGNNRLAAGNVDAGTPSSTLPLQ